MTVVNQPNAVSPVQSASAGGGVKFRLDKVFTTIQALLDDPSGVDYDQDYLLPFVNLAWEKIGNRFSGLGLTYEEDVQVLSSVPAGTTNLSDYQAEGGALEAILVPLRIEWKEVGTVDTEYRKVAQATILPDVDATTEGVRSYEWRKGVIFITPSAIAVDLRVRFKTFSLDFSGGEVTREIIVGARNVLAHKTCEIIMSPGIRNNVPAMQWHREQYENDASEFENLCVKQKNGPHLRIRRMSGRRRGLPRYFARVQP